MRIAVIGSGISGLGAAHYLAQRHDVVLYEQDARVGGHSNTVRAGGHDIDTGFIVCNPVNYPNFYPFLDELGIARQDTDMSLGVSVEGGRIEWAGDENLAKIFAQPALMFSPEHIRMLLAVLRFNKHVKQLLDADALPDITLGEFLERHAYPMSLRVRYVAAMAGPIWSTSTRGVMDFPFPFFARFFDAHGLLNVYQRPQWQTVVGGSKNYVDAIVSRFRGELRRGAAVRSLRRGGEAAWISTADGEDRYDAVVCAAHADQALRLLTDASEAERAVLSQVPYTRNIAYLHTDETLMPRRRAAWSAWNALLARDALSDEPIGVTYWMNRLQNLPGREPYFVSLNPPQAPRAERVLYQTEYEHPLYNLGTLRAQELLPTMQGRNRVWWAGAWTRYGFHEDGFTSALRAVAGIDRGCLPPWARLEPAHGAAPLPAPQLAPQAA
ncbi:MAG TPA: FAD-dependent oxidoreductase [Nevskiaceae bacterium]|nr:FAD-dependent oxidoreductase [Nevskiaceae bacterium]